MAAAAAVSGGVEGKREEVPLLPVIALPVASFPDTISRMDAGVPRKARTARLRAVPSGWWAFRLPVPQPKKEGNPRPQRSRVAPTPPDFDAAAPAAKKPRRCLQCGAVVTPQWRSGPMGQCTLCNACGVRLRAVGALREAEHRPPLAKVRKVAPPPPPQESPAVVSPPGSQIRKERRRALVEEDIYLVRKQPNQEGQPPAEVPYLVKKKKPAKRTWKPRNTGQQCHHCGTTSTPQWREGPMGRHTLCNACGVRYRQGRLLPEYRPAASPTFVASQHACRHREVIALHKRQQPDKEQPAPVGEDGSSLTNQRVDSGSGDAPGSDGDDPYNVVLMRRQLPADKDRYPPTPLHCPLPQQAVEEDPRAGRKNELTAGAATSGCGKGNELMDAPDSVDPLLLNGPSAPLLVDGENFIVD